MRPITWTAAATIGMHFQRISAQTVRNLLRKAYLHTCHPHWGLDLTAVCHGVAVTDLRRQTLTFFDV